MTAGELVYRATYEGRRVRKRHSGAHRDNSGGTRSLIARTLICSALALALWACRSLEPEYAMAVSKKLSDNFDYRAAFSAIGRSIAGEGELREVWSAFLGESAASGHKTGPETDFRELIPSPGDTPALNDGPWLQAGADSVPQHTAELSAAPAATPVVTYYAQKLAHGVKTLAPFDIEDGEDAEEFSELLLPFPREEDADEESAPETVSYDFYVLDFDSASPLEGKLTSDFGYRIHPITGKLSFHYGVDIGAPAGSAITAFADGTVELVDYNNVYGNYLFIRHPDGILTFYGHCREIEAQEGQLVKKGARVACVGSTGWSTGPHLHFEVRNGDTILDPSHYLET